MRVWADIYNAAGSKQGSILSVISASVTRILDGAGEISLTIPPADARAMALAQNEYRAILYLYDDVRGKREMGRGPLRILQNAQGADGMAMVASGLDQLDELRRVNTLRNRHYSDTVANVVDDLISLASGWSAVTTGVTGSIDITFDGVSVLKALQELATRTGYHFRVYGDHYLHFGPLASTPSVTAIQPGSRITKLARENTSVALIERLQITDTSEEVTNWIIPVGGDQQTGEVTLARSTRPGEVVESNTTPASTTYIDNASSPQTDAIAVSIQLATAQRVYGVTLAIARHMTDVPDLSTPKMFKVRIETDSGGTPSGTLAHADAAGEFDLRDVLTSRDADAPDSFFVRLANLVTLSASTTYWLVVESDSYSSSDGLECKVWTNGGVYSGVGLRRNQSTGVWSGIGDMVFDLWGIGESDEAYAIEQGTGPDGAPYYYLRDTDSISSYGQIERVVSYEVAATGASDAEQIAAANALYDAAAYWLDDAAQKQTTYNATLRGASGILYPGYKLRLIYKGMAYGPDGTPSLAVDVNDTFWIVQITEQADESGLSTVVELSNLARAQRDAAQIVGNAVETISGIMLQQTSGASVAPPAHIAGGRISLDPDDPAPLTDQTAKTEIHYIPANGGAGQARLYDGSQWSIYPFDQVSLSLSGLSANTNYDIYLYNSSGGALTLEAVAWSGSTTRATALARKDGVLVKSGSPDRLYLGTIRTTATAGQCEDSKARRFVWNQYNQIVRRTSVSDSTTHTYNVATWRAWNNAAGTYRYEMVIGVGAVIDAALASVFAAGADGRNVNAGIMLDATNAANEYMYARVAQAHRMGITTSLDVAAGYHYVACTEYGDATTAANFYAATLSGRWLA